MFRRILVPVDLSKRAGIAIEAASGLAKADDASVVLLHVIETIRDLESDEIDEFYGLLRERAVGELERWGARFEESEIPVEREIVVGRRVPEIVRHAEELGCDLIVLGSRELDPEAPASALGSISHQVALLAGCPVLLMR